MHQSLTGLSLLLVLGTMTAWGADPSAPAPPPRELLKPLPLAACNTCHQDHGMSGHKPLNKGCLACHVEDAESSRRERDPNDTREHPTLIDPMNPGCAGCHEETEHDIEHPEVEGGRCLSCHDPHDRSDADAHLAGKPESAVCYRCHEPLNEVHVHTVAKRGVCTSCHTLHGSSQPGLLTGRTSTDSCRSCHPPSTAPDKHPPAAKNDCSACHDPHGSDQPGLLVVPSKNLCWQCHKEFKEKPVVHSAVLLGRCSGCHNPHESLATGLAGSRPIAQTCFNCHADDVTGRNYVHAPVESGDCVTCHDPHDAKNRSQLRTQPNLTCAACHSDKWRTDVMTPHQAVLADGCTACHDPHGSDYDLGLRMPEIELCVSCHTEKDDGMHIAVTMLGAGHPVGGDAKDPLREGRALTCSSCHDPHGSDSPTLFYRSFTKMGVCIECHRDMLVGKDTPMGKSDIEINDKAARKRYFDRQKKLEATPEGVHGEKSDAPKSP